MLWEPQSPSLSHQEYPEPLTAFLQLVVVAGFCFSGKLLHTALAWTWQAVTRCHFLCRTGFKQNGPILVIAPATSVDNWHSNWEFWGGPEVNVVSYVGSTAARALLHDHELWLSPESLDSRSSFLQKQGLPPKVLRVVVWIRSPRSILCRACVLLVICR